MAMTQEELKKEIFEYLEDRYGLTNVCEVEQETEYDSYRTWTTIWYNVGEQRLNHKVIDLSISEILGLE